MKVRNSVLLFLFSKRPNHISGIAVRLSSIIPFWWGVRAGGVCFFWGGVRWGGRFPLGGHSHLLLYTHLSYLTQPAPATRKSGLDA